MRNYTLPVATTKGVVATKPFDLLEAFDRYTKEAVGKSESQTMPEVFAGGRAELAKLIAKEGIDQGALPDYLYVIERIHVAVIKNGMFPQDLRGPVVYATDCKRSNGPGSEERPHYRELAQVRKYAGRLQQVANVKMWAANMYAAVCEYLGVTNPQNIELDPEMKILVDALWNQGKDELKF